MVDVVGDADVLDVVVAGVEVAPLTEVNVEIVERDGRMSSAPAPHTSATLSPTLISLVRARPGKWTCTEPDTCTVDMQIFRYFV